MAKTKYDMPESALSTMGVGKTLTGISSKYVSLTPLFWKWIRTRNGFKAQLNNSLVYIASCLTDRTPDLRNAIGSRAYFAFSEPGPPKLAGAVFQYLVKHLVRNTHSAEEAYYNIIRIVNTQQKIYKEDNVFDNIPLKSADLPGYPPQELVNCFHGSFWNGREMQRYEETGWLGLKGSQGNIWWLAFTGRWGTNENGSTAGANNLETCWNEYWKKGETAGFGDVLCNAMDPGVAPTQDEVAYATYLITGEPRLSFSGIKAARWTLNDAK